MKTRAWSLASNFYFLGSSLHTGTQGSAHPLALASSPQLPLSNPTLPPISPFFHTQQRDFSTPGPLPMLCPLPGTGGSPPPAPPFSPPRLCHLLIKPLLSPGQALTPRAIMEQPRLHQSHSFLPQRRPLQAAARTVTLETRAVFVTIMYLPSGQSPPSTPCRTRRLPQARTSTESGPARSPDVCPGHPAASGVRVGGRGSPTSPSPHNQLLGTILAP